MRPFDPGVTPDDAHRTTLFAMMRSVKKFANYLAPDDRRLDVLSARVLAARYVIELTQGSGEFMSDRHSRYTLTLEAWQRVASEVASWADTDDPKTATARANALEWAVQKMIEAQP